MPPDGSQARQVTGDNQDPPRGITPFMTMVFAVASGTMVANIYYAQPLTGLISSAIGMHGRLAGLIVTLTQLGFGSGLILIGSLADLVENRKLVLLTLAGTFLALIGVATSSSATGFLIASFVVGFGAVGTQVLVPFAAYLAPDKIRGRVVGNVMGGLIAGIMLARPFSSVIAASFGWRAVFWVSAAMMLVLAIILRMILPQRRPSPGMHYGQLLLSTASLLFTIPLLRRRAAYQAILFAAFNLFWTAAPLLLTARFGLTQNGIALFALAGAGGALAAPIAGRLADRGLGTPATGGAMLLAGTAFLAAGWAGSAGFMIALVIAAIAIDGAIQTNHVVSQRAIYALADELRGRLNAVYMACTFAGGAAGSALASITFFYGGWWATALTGTALALLALAVFATEFRPRHG